jgi:hypothetical protein
MLLIYHLTAHLKKIRERKLKFKFKDNVYRKPKKELKWKKKNKIKISY